MEGASALSSPSPCFKACSIISHKSWSSVGNQGAVNVMYPVLYATFCHFVMPHNLSDTAAIVAADVMIMIVSSLCIHNGESPALKFHESQQRSTCSKLGHSAQAIVPATVQESSG
jgi:hypothetical protein